MYCVDVERDKMLQARFRKKQKSYMKEYAKTIKPRYREAYGSKFIISTTDNAVKLVTRKYLEQNYKGRYIVKNKGKQTTFIVEDLK